MRLFLFLVFCLILPFLSLAANQVDLYFFYSETCPHCKKIEPRLDEWQQKYNLNLKKFEISENEENRQLFLKLGFNSVPTIMINDKIFVGDLDSTLEAIENEIKYCQENQCVSPEERIKQLPEETKNNKIIYVLAITAGIVLGVIIFSIFRAKK